MNTYFELASYLENVVNYDINDEIISNLNDAIIDLRDERYNRFLNHILDILDNRINMFYKNLHDKLDHIKTLSEFESEFNILTDEIDLQLKLVTINLINEDDKNKLTEFIKTNFNEILNRLKTHYKNNSMFTHYINKYYL